MSGDETRSKLRRAVDALFREDKRIVTAESLTCGGISAEIVKMPRVSDTLIGGFAVYNDDMKVNMLGVPRSVIDRFTAVSAQVAHYMARGALEKTASCAGTAADVSIAVTGYAGSPNGFADESEAGKVFIALATAFNGRNAGDIDVNVYQHKFDGTRVEVQQQTIAQSVDYLFQLACHNNIIPSTATAVHRIPNFGNDAVIEHMVRPKILAHT